MSATKNRYANCQSFLLNDLLHLMFLILCFPTMQKQTRPEGVLIFIQGRKCSWNLGVEKYRVSSTYTWAVTNS